MRVIERVSPVAAALSALGTLACCLPFGVAGAVGALGLSVVLETLRPWLIAAAVILLAISGVQIYRNGRQCRRRSRLSLVVFMLSAVIVAAVILFSQALAELIATLH